MSDFAVRPAIITRTQQSVLTFLGSQERLMAESKDTGGEFALLEGGGTRGHNAPRHRHLHASETFIVLEGELLVEVGDDKKVAAAGDVAVLPRNIPHTFVIVSETARYLTLHTPAGFDLFVHDVSDLARTGGSREDLLATALKHGIEILGPGPSLPGSEHS